MRGYDEPKLPMHTLSVLWMLVQMERIGYGPIGLFVFHLQHPKKDR
jgi:hypothetical protein